MQARDGRGGGSNPRFVLCGCRTWRALLKDHRPVSLDAGTHCSVERPLQCAVLKILADSSGATADDPGLGPQSVTSSCPGCQLTVAMASRSRAHKAAARERRLGRVGAARGTLTRRISRRSSGLRCDCAAGHKNWSPNVDPGSLHARPFAAHSGSQCSVTVSRTVAISCLIMLIPLDAGLQASAVVGSMT